MHVGRSSSSEGLAVLRARAGRWLAHTPGRLRLLSVSITVSFSVGALLVWSVLSQRITAADHLRRQSAPVMVEAQRMSSALAEANSAATAMFLAGKDESREQRRQYENTLSGLSRSLERSARLVGDDDAAHSAIVRISDQAIRYAGFVERARTQNRSNDAAAQESLVRAVTFATDQIAPNVEAFALDARSRMDRDASRSRLAGPLPPAVVGVLVLMLLLAQLFIAKVSRRILNVPLLLATVILVGLGGWLMTAASRQNSDLRSAERGGVAGIDLLARMRSQAYQIEVDQNRSLIAGDVPPETAESRSEIAKRDVSPAVAAAARTGVDNVGGRFGEIVASSQTSYQRALIAEAMLRWQRYVDVGKLIATTPDPAGRSDIATTQGQTTFTGFNATIDSLLTSSEGNFLRLASDAGTRLGALPIGFVVIVLFGALLALMGVQQRIREYA